MLKADLSGGRCQYRMPSGKFGANAAWWAIMILAPNLNALMKRLALGAGWVSSRMKAMRLHLINRPGRVVRRARLLINRLMTMGLSPYAKTIPAMPAEAPSEGKGATAGTSISSTKMT